MGLLTSGRTTTCSSACSGGVSRMWLANKDDISSTTEDATGVTAITMVATKVFYEFEFFEETGQFTEAVTVENCAVVVESTFRMLWKCRNQTDRNLITDMAGNCCGMVCIHLEETDVAWIWGHNTKQRVFLRNNNSDTGLEFNNPNQEEIILGARTKQKAVVFVPGAAGVPV